MKTLACVESPPLYITKPSPWNPRTSILNQITTMKTLNLPTRTWKLRAGAKGFTGGPAKETVLARKINGKREEDDDYDDDDDDDDDEKIPDVVMERMIFRILFNVGVPLITGIALLQVFDILKEQKSWDVPLWVPFLTTLITFGASALGVAYGALSTSWDVDKKGSIFGFEEAQKNWVEMWKVEEDGK